MGLLNEMKQYFIHENTDFIDDEEAVTDFSDLADQDIDNDGEVDDSDRYLHKRLGTIAKMDESVMSDVHQMIQDAESVEDFVNSFFAKYGNKIKRNSATEKWVMSLYDESLAEMNTTSATPGFESPYAFGKADDDTVEADGWKKIPKTNKIFKPMESKSTYKKMMAEMYGLNESVKVKGNLKKIFGDSITDVDVDDNLNYIVQGDLDKIKSIAKKNKINIEDVEHWGIRLFIESLNEAVKYDIEAAVKKIRDFNRGSYKKYKDGAVEQLALDILDDLRINHTGGNVDDTIDHLGASMDDDDRIPEDRDLVRELYPLLEAVNYDVVETMADFLDDSPAQIKADVKKYKSIKKWWNAYKAEALEYGTLYDSEIKGFEKEFKQHLKEAVSYRDYKKDPTSTPVQKVNKGIAEVNRMLSEMEKIVNNNLRLKQEAGVDSSHFWKTTGTRFAKINERMTRISNRLKELSK